MVTPVTDQKVDTDTIVSSPATPPRASRGSWAARMQINRFSGVYLWIGLIVLFAVWIPDTFLTNATLTGIIMDQSITVVLALGVLIALAAGQFDLSAAQTLGFAAVFHAWMMTVKDIDPIVSTVLTLAACLLIGLINGLIIAVVGINSFIATLGTSSIILAVTSLVSGDKFVGPIEDGYRQLALAKPLGVPILFIYVLIFAVIVWYVLEHSPVGRRLQSTGANPETARLVGVRTNRYIVGCMMASSFMAGIAGVLLLSRIGSVSSTIGPSYLLPAFAGCFLGTTQLKPGRYNVWGTLLALFLLATGVKGFQLASGQNWINAMFNGVALILAVGLAVIFERRRTQAGSRD